MNHGLYGSMDLESPGSSQLAEECVSPRSSGVLLSTASVSQCRNTDDLA